VQLNTRRGSGTYVNAIVAVIARSLIRKSPIQYEQGVCIRRALKRRRVAESGYLLSSNHKRQALLNECGQLLERRVLWEARERPAIGAAARVALVQEKEMYRSFGSHQPQVVPLSQRHFVGVAARTRGGAKAKHAEGRPDEHLRGEHNVA